MLIFGLSLASIRSKWGGLSVKRLYAQIILLSLGLFQIGCNSAVSFAPKESEAGQSLSTPPCASCEVPIANQTAKDTFSQATKSGKIDILFVDDNSGSMTPEQTLLGQRFTAFINNLSDLDWQIGITTTDVSNHPTNGLQGTTLPLAGFSGEYILNSSFPDAEEIFQKTIVRQETINCDIEPANCPSGDEQPLAASIMAMEKYNTSNKNLFRNNVDLAIVILSDEDERSDGPPNATQPAEVVAKFKSIWGDTKNLGVYGIIIKPDDVDCLNTQRQQSGGSGSYGRVIDELVQLTGGVSGSVCDANYSLMVNYISEKVRELAGSFKLSHTPKEGSVKVSLTPIQNIEWKVKGDKLTFKTPPDLNTHIEVTYDY